jgi:hypothetical protein
LRAALLAVAGVILIAMSLAACAHSAPDNPFVGTWGDPVAVPAVHVVISRAGSLYHVALYRPSGTFVEGWDAQRSGDKLSRPGHAQGYAAVLDPDSGRLKVSGTHWFGEFQRLSGSTSSPVAE